MSVSAAQNVRSSYLQVAHSTNRIFLLPNTTFRLCLRVVDEPVVRRINHQDGVTIGQWTFPGVPQACVSMKNHFINNRLEGENSPSPPKAEEGEHAYGQN